MKGKITVGSALHLLASVISVDISVGAKKKHALLCLQDVTAQKRSSGVHRARMLY